MIEDTRLIRNDIRCIRTMADKLDDHITKADQKSSRNDIKEIYRCADEILQLLDDNPLPSYMSADEEIILRNEIRSKRIIPFGGQ